MKMTIFLNGKKITKKAAEKCLGKERLQQRISEAKSDFQEDPHQEIGWSDGMVIQFS